MLTTNLYASIILTYRCNARCNMCDVYQYPTHKQDEITALDLEQLPAMSFVNITGGEPFIRTDIADVVAVLNKKTKRIVISTNGYFTDKIIQLCKKYPKLGIRISIEGLPKTNDKIRGITDGFDRGIRTLLALRNMGMKDIGFGMTVQDINAKDLLPLYHLADALGYEFATATLHNSHYFHKHDNVLKDRSMVIEQFEKLIQALLNSRSPKKWFRAYFNHGLIHYINGGKRLLPCEMGRDAFFIDPWGDVLPCNGMDKKESMGNIRKQHFSEIWESERAAEIKQMVRKCNKQCWMIGSAVPAIKKNLFKTVLWIMKSKLNHYPRDVSKVIQASGEAKE
jgi:MoaA/NifB/PqqE/SkfB family radical SAM enzyme